MTQVSTTCATCHHPMASAALFCPNCGSPRVRDGSADPLVGKVLGERFLIQERIGHGKSGAIFRAEHVTLRRKVAIKVLHHELSRDDLALERFRREATTVAELDNEHIVEIHDFGRTQDGRLYLAMELLEGETLDAILSHEGRLSVERTVDILIQACDALAEAHAIGYVHRDLRPRNLFLAVRRGRSNFVKLLDFGLSKLVETEGAAASTSLGMTFGDPRYMSPEQARGDRIDRRADIYQLGCIAYEMLTGQPPFVGGRVFDVLSRHVSEMPALLTAQRKDVPRWLEVTVLRMLAKAPDDRFATTTRMAEALRQGAATGEVMPETVARRRESVPPPSVSRIMQKMGISPDADPAPDASISVEVASKLMAPDPVRLGEDPSASELLPAGLPRPAKRPASASELSPGMTAVGVPRAPAGEGAVVPQAPAPPPAPSGGDPGVTMRDGAAWKRPADAPPVPEVEVVMPAASEPIPSPVPAPPSAPTSVIVDGASGKQTRVRGKPSDTAGISQVWFADGDRLDGGRALEESQAQRLDRARVMISPSSTGVLTEEYYEDAQKRPWGTWAAIGAAGVAVLIAIAALAWPSSPERASKAPPAPTLPSAAAPEPTPAPAPQPLVAPAPAVVVVDAGVAAAPEPAKVEPAKPEPAKVEPAKVEPAKVEPAKPEPAKPVVAAKPEPKPARPAPAPKPTRDLLTPPTAVAPSTSPSAATTTASEDAKKAEFFARLGLQALRAGDYVSAAGNFKSSLELDPNNAEATAGLGEIALQQGLYNDAVGHLRKASKMAPRNARVQTLLGEAYLNAGKVPAAEAAFKRALQIDPDNARARDGYNEAAGRMPPPQDEP